MAKRIVFLPTLASESLLFREVLVDFDWIPGMAISQARKSVTNLHSAILEQLGFRNVLEISTRSLSDLGIRLSAFNLQVAVNDYQTSVETVYQSSKVFKNGGPYLDLLHGPSVAAKQDEGNFWVLNSKSTRGHSEPHPISMTFSILGDY